MSNNPDVMKAKLREIKRLQEDIVGMLIDNPCLDGNSKKKELYQQAINYYENKRRKVQADGKFMYNGANTTKLSVLIKGYHESQENGKQEYARKIARFMLEMTNFWLKMISEEVREDAFQIIINYLEEQKNS